MKQWQEHNFKFVWVRRYKTEVAKALEAFTKLGYLIDAKGVYYETWPKAGNDKSKRKPKPVKHYIGLVITISTASRIRGGEFNEFTTMVIDEYGDEAGTMLRQEFLMINSLIVSVLDEKLVGRVLVLSNNVNRFLPLYNHIGVKWDQEWTYNWKMDAIVHVWDHHDNEWVGASAKWLTSTEYGNYAIYNQPLDANDNLVSASVIEYAVPEVCFRLGLVNEVLGLYVYEHGYVIGECVNCPHDVKMIDNINSIKYIKNVCNPTKLKIFDAYTQRLLKYTKPVYHDYLTRFIANNLDLI